MHACKQDASIHNAHIYTPGRFGQPYSQHSSCLLTAHTHQKSIHTNKQTYKQTYIHTYKHICNRKISTIIQPTFQLFIDCTRSKTHVHTYIHTNTHTCTHIYICKISTITQPTLQLSMDCKQTKSHIHILTYIHTHVYTLGRFWQWSSWLSSCLLTAHPQKNTYIYIHTNIHSYTYMYTWKISAVIQPTLQLSIHCTQTNKNIHTYMRTYTYLEDFGNDTTNTPVIYWLGIPPARQNDFWSSIPPRYHMLTVCGGRGCSYDRMTSGVRRCVGECKYMTEWLLVICTIVSQRAHCVCEERASIWKNDFWRPTLRVCKGGGYMTEWLLLCTMVSTHAHCAWEERASTWQRWLLVLCAACAWRGELYDRIDSSSSYHRVTTRALCVGWKGINMVEWVFALYAMRGGGG